MKESRLIYIISTIFFGMALNAGFEERFPDEFPNSLVIIGEEKTIQGREIKLMHEAGAAFLIHYEGSFIRLRKGHFVTESVISEGGDIFVFLIARAHELGGKDYWNLLSIEESQSGDFLFSVGSSMLEIKDTYFKDYQEIIIKDISHDLSDFPIIYMELILHREKEESVQWVAYDIHTGILIEVE